MLGSSTLKSLLGLGAAFVQLGEFAHQGTVNSTTEHSGPVAVDRDSQCIARVAQHSRKASRPGWVVSTLIW